MQQLGVLLAQVHLPEVISTLKGCQVVERGTVFRDDGAAHARGIRRKAHNAVFDVLQFHHDIFRLLGLLVFPGLGITFFLLARRFLLVIILILGLLLFGLQFLEQLVVFLAQAVFVVSILVEEYQHGIVLRTPRGVCTHTVTLGSEKDGIAVEHKPLV